jgi:acyl-CoA dehydrogenase
MLDFSISPELEARLAWIRRFVADKVEPMDALFDQDHLQPWDAGDAASRAVLKPLQQIVKAQGLWGLHLPKSLGGPGFGNVELCYVNEILGRTHWGPVVFGCQAPDSGNGEIIARYGTPAQKKRFLEPLQSGEIFSCFSMTEVEGGSDPRQIRCEARLEGEHWIINGEKWFSSNAHRAAFLIVLVRTDAEAANTYERFSTLIVPADTPGIEFIRKTGLALEPYGHGGHPHVRYNNVRVPKDALLGPRGQGFKVAQSRLGGGRLHHAMRAIGSTRKALDMMLERAVSRVTQGDILAHKQLVQADIAQCWIEIEQLQLLVLKTAWLLDRGDEQQARIWIGASKVKCAQVAQHVVLKAMHLLGSLGLSNETPLARLFIEFPVLGIADGPTEVHLLQIGRTLLKSAKPAPGRFPSDYLPDLKAQARHKLGLEPGPERGP